MAFGLDDIIETGVGAAEAAIGLIGEGKAKNKQDYLRSIRPKLTSSPFIRDDLALAKSELASGMSAEAKSAYETGLDRDLSTSLGALLKGGGSVNSVGDLFDRSEQGRNRLALVKENLRLNKVNNVVNASNQAEQERQQMFQFNEWSPWSDEMQAASQSRQQSANMVQAGIGTATSGLMQGFGKKDLSNQFNSYFGSNNQPQSYSEPNLPSSRVSANPPYDTSFESPSKAIRADFSSIPGMDMAGIDVPIYNLE